MKQHHKTQPSPSLVEHTKNYIKKRVPRTLTDILFLATQLILLFWLSGILFVMPFYNTDGYNYIGTDKANFFHRVTILSIKLFLPCFVGWLLSKCYDLHREKTLSSGIRALWRSFSITEAFAFAYLLSILISFLLSPYKEVAIWGEKGWFMGLMPQLSCIVIFFLLAHFSKVPKWFYLLVYPVSAVVFFLGYLNRFGWYIQGYDTLDATRISSIGNINWYCAYLITILSTAFAIKLLWSDLHFTNSKVKKFFSLLLNLYLFIGYATLMNQGTLSGYVILFFLLIIAFYIAAPYPEKIQSLAGQFFLLSLACFLSYILQILQIGSSTYEDSIVYLMTWSYLPPIMLFLSLAFCFFAEYKRPLTILRKPMNWFFIAGIVVFIAYLFLLIYNSTHDYAISFALGWTGADPISFTPDWASGRGGTWRAGYAIYRDMPILQKLFGVGPDCMYSYYSQNGSPELVNLMNVLYGMRRLTNAHNEVFTILINNGLLGAICFICFITSMFIRSIKAYKQRALLSPTRILPLLSCTFGLFAYLTGNIIGFEQTLTLPLFYILLGLLEKDIKVE